jgi:hypothetical protein
MIKVKSFKKLKGGKKKYEITFEKNGKKYIRKFGAQGMSDFTIHKDRERRERYISRHKKDLRTNDPMKPGYLSMYILWNKPSLKASLADYKRRLGVYNRTGKFPKGITGSKKLSFGAADPCSAETLTNLPEEYATGNAFGKKNTTGGSPIPSNVVNKVLYASIKAKIKRSIKGRRWGAYDSGRLVREYKAKGGKYRGSKGKTDLSRWYKEKWVDACAWPKRKPCGRKTKSSIAYCRPSKRVDSKTPKLVQQLTKAQIKSRCAKKKKSPMKRVTKFGRQTADETVAWGDGAWVIHCNYYPWGAHSTIRYKPLAERPGDYSYHYGIYNDGTLRLWATGGARNTPIPQGLRTILINYYNNRCGGNMTFGKNQELIDKMRQQMFKELMSGPDVNTSIQNTIIKRCKRGFSDQFCQDIFTQLLLSMYFTVVSKSKMTPARQNNLKEMESFIPANFKPTMLNINKNHFSKIDEMLYLLQDHTYGNFKNARIASLLYEYIHQK